MVNEVESKEGVGILEQIFQHVLIISKGECQITDDVLMNASDDRHFNILSGLQMLHEDLALYKAELKAKMEAEFQLEVLKKRNEELAQFNYVASHDLQEPLRTIQSFTDLLMKDHQVQLDENGKIYLNLIKESSSRMSDLILDLLDYSQVGKRINLELVDCNKLVKHIIKDLNRIILETSPIIGIGELPTIHGDKTRLRQVFQNLISNALKFKKEDQHIQLNIFSYCNTDEIIFCVEDNGIGIDKSYQERIFGIFQRLHSKSEFEGTGIGLALCKKIIEMHNGKMWVESEPGLGSKFFFSLPKN